MAPLYYTTMTDEYENLLKQAYSNITEKTESSERFVVPEAKAYVEGKTTVLENFSEIVSKVRRDPDHLMKFLLGELGTSGKIDGNRAIFNGKFEITLIKMMIKSYVEDYVICSECGKPDTRLVKDDRVMQLRCDACGSHRPVRKRKARTEPVSENLEEGTDHGSGDPVHLKTRRWRGEDGALYHVCCKFKARAEGKNQDLKDFGINRIYRTGNGRINFFKFILSFLQMLFYKNPAAVSKHAAKGFASAV